MYRIRLLQLLNDCSGQDLVEYALTTGFIVVSAGAISPNAITAVSVVFSRITSVMANTPSGG